MISDFPAFTDFGQCFNQDGNFYKLDYLTTYPDRDLMGSHAGYFIGFDHLEQTCTSKNMNYFSYLRFSMSEFDKAVMFGTCQNKGHYSMMYENMCSSSRNIMVTVWMSTDCSGAPEATLPVFDGNCKDAMDGDDDDDDDDDDDGFDYSHSLQLQFCT
jgi:hypothetical protein